MTRVVDSPLADRNSAERRSFLARFAATVIGGLVALFPFLAGVGVLFNPLLRRRGEESDAATDATLVRIGPLDMLPADGVPHEFSAIADFVDAWTHVPNQRVGLVYLSRTDVDGKPQIVAFTATCPHLGCAVEFRNEAGQYECPCHESAFAKDGQKLFGPSLRGLDPLAVKLVDADGGPEIWVGFERFRTGVAERIPVG